MPPKRSNCERYGGFQPTTKMEALIAVAERYCKMCEEISLNHDKLPTNVQYNLTKEALAMKEDAKLYKIEQEKGSK